MILRVFAVQFVPTARLVRQEALFSLSVRGGTVPKKPYPGAIATSRHSVHRPKAICLGIACPKAAEIVLVVGRLSVSVGSGAAPAPRPPRCCARIASGAAVKTSSDRTTAARGFASNALFFAIDCPFVYLSLPGAPGSTSFVAGCKPRGTPSISTAVRAPRSPTMFSPVSLSIFMTMPSSPPARDVPI